MNMPAQPTCTCMLSLHTVPESYSYSYLVLTPYLWITHPVVASSRCRKTAVSTSSERMPASVKCCSSVVSHVLLSTNRAALAQFIKVSHARRGCLRSVQQRLRTKRHFRALRLGNRAKTNSRPARSACEQEL
jgi:hypothetical protein